jgi:hypothetical protein
MDIDMLDMDFMQEPVDVTEESAIVKERMTRIGNILTNMEKMDFEEPDHKNNIENENSPTMSPINPDARLTTRKDLGLFFGHQDWNLIMNMMIGFRAGLKK